MVTAVTLILFATLPPGASPASTEPTTCLICGNRGTADAIVNVALFLPLGIALALRGVSLPKILITGLALSAGVEAAQWFIPGRYPSIRDLLFNPLGTVLGGWLLVSRFVRFDLSRRRSATRSLVAALVAVGTFAGTGMLLHPSLPSTTYYGQWTPQLGHLDWYRGEILGARIDTISLPPARLENTAEIRTALQRQAVIHLDVITAPSTDRLSSMLSVYDDRQREIFLIGPDRDDLVYRYRTVSAQLRLDQPDLRVRGALRTAGIGDTVPITIEQQGGGTCISLNDDRECGLGFTVGSGWSVLFFLESFPKTVQQILGMGWIAMLVVPVSLWARPDWRAYLAAVILLGGLVLIPHHVGLLPSPPLEWVGALLGAGAGFAIRRIHGALVNPSAPEAGSVAPAHHRIP